MIQSIPHSRRCLRWSEKRRKVVYFWSKTSARRLKMTVPMIHPWAAALCPNLSTDLSQARFHSWHLKCHRPILCFTERAHPPLKRSCLSEENPKWKTHAETKLHLILFIHLQGAEERRSTTAQYPWQLCGPRRHWRLVVTRRQFAAEIVIKAGKYHPLWLFLRLVWYHI